MRHEGGPDSHELVSQARQQLEEIRDALQVRRRLIRESMELLSEARQLLAVVYASHFTDKAERRAASRR